MHRIVIVGGGAGGLELATRLGKTLGRDRRAQVTLVDCNLTHIWKPLLHEVAAGSLDAATDGLSYVAQAQWNHFDFVYGRMQGLDRARKVIALAPWSGTYGEVQVPATELGYDTLVMAVGSVCNDFGIAGVREHCIFLDSHHDAERLRLEMLERRLAATAQGRPRALRVVVIGGGATGVELSAELRDSQRKLSRYRGSSSTREHLAVTLVEASPRLLPALPEKIGASVETELRDKLNIHVMTNTTVQRVEPGLLIDSHGETVAADIIVWAAGIRGPAFLRQLAGLETNRIDQLLVRPTLQSTQDDAVFALGDCAACPMDGSKDGKTRNVPPRAQAAHQQADLLVTNLARRIQGKPLKAFRYTDNGSLVSLASFNTFGHLMGNRFVEGRLAHFFYASLYRMHQAALYGHRKTLRIMLGTALARNIRPLLKLH